MATPSDVDFGTKLIVSRYLHIYIQIIWRWAWLSNLAIIDHLLSKQCWNLQVKNTFSCILHFIKLSDISSVSLIFFLLRESSVVQLLRKYFLKCIRFCWLLSILTYPKGPNQSSKNQERDFHNFSCRNCWYPLRRLIGSDGDPWRWSQEISWVVRAPGRLRPWAPLPLSPTLFGFPGGRCPLIKSPECILRRGFDLWPRANNCFYVFHILMGCLSHFCFMFIVFKAQ